MISNIVRSFLILFALSAMAGSVIAAPAKPAAKPSAMKQFENAYMSFELPAHWNCQLDQTEWSCRSTKANEQKEAIIIFTAKEVGPTDNFEAYKEYFGKNQNARTKGVQINDQPWLDSLQLGRELPNYYTRYLITIKNNIAVLVTFSAHRLRYTNYSSDFFRSIRSLKVNPQKALLAEIAQDKKVAGMRKGGPGSQGLLANVPGGDAGQEAFASSLPQESSGSGVLFIYAALLLALVGGGVFVYSKKKRA